MSRLNAEAAKDAKKGQYFFSAAFAAFAFKRVLSSEFWNSKLKTQDSN